MGMVCGRGMLKALNPSPNVQKRWKPRFLAGIEIKGICVPSSTKIQGCCGLSILLELALRLRNIAGAKWLSFESLCDPEDVSELI